jgi:hypothetical protein
MAQAHDSIFIAVTSEGDVELRSTGRAWAPVPTWSFPVSA